MKRWSFGTIGKAVAAGVLALGILVQTSVPAYAATTQNITADSSATCSVTATITSTYTVTIPKTLAVASACVEGGCTVVGSHTHYAVVVTGDIATNEQINVVPDATFSLSATGRTDVTMAVTQTKKAWSSADAAASATTAGIVATSDNSKLKAGVWSGTLGFAISKTTTP